MRRAEGFTLIEMLVVILIIAILMALLGVFIVNFIENGKNATSRVLIDTLEKGCENYRTAYKKYPPATPKETRCLHYYLGGIRTEPAFHTKSGPVPMVEKAPFIEFKEQHLKDPTKPLVPPNVNQTSDLQDAFEGVIYYSFSGTPEKPYLWSKGKDPADPADDLKNTEASY